MGCWWISSRRAGPWRASRISSTAEGLFSDRGEHKAALHPARLTSNPWNLSEYWVSDCGRRAVRGLPAFPLRATKPPIVGRDARRRPHRLPLAAGLSDPIPHIRREPFGMVIFPLCLPMRAVGRSRLSQRALRPPLVGTISAPRGTGCRWLAPGELRSWISRRHLITSASGRESSAPGIGQLHAWAGAGGRECRGGSDDFREPAVSLNLLLGTFNLIPNAAGWHRRPRIARLRRHGAPSSHFGRSLGLQHDRPAAGVAGVRSLFQPVFPGPRALYPSQGYGN